MAIQRRDTRRRPAAERIPVGGKTYRDFLRTLRAEPAGGSRLLLLGAAFAVLAETRGLITALVILGAGVAVAATAGYAIWRRGSGRR